jgi:hypothetical protein
MDGIIQVPLLLRRLPEHRRAADIGMIEIEEAARVELN